MSSPCLKGDSLLRNGDIITRGIAFGSSQLIQLRADKAPNFARRHHLSTMKRQMNVNEAFVKDKKQKIRTEQPPHWIKTWSLARWMKAKGARKALGTNAVTKWKKNEKGEWIRCGVFRWRNTLYDKANWDAENDVIKDACGYPAHAGSGLWSLNSEIIRDFKEQKVLVFHGKVKRDVKDYQWGIHFDICKEPQYVYLFMYWNMDIQVVYEFARKSKAGLLNKVVDSVSLQKGEQEKICISTIRINSDGDWRDRNYISFITPEEEMEPTNGSYGFWRHNDTGVIYIGFDALLIGGDETYPEVKEENNIHDGRKTVWESRMGKSDLPLWNYWMYGCESLALENFEGHFCALPQSGFRYHEYMIQKRERMESIIALIPVLSHRKSEEGESCLKDSVFLVFDLVVKYITNTEWPWPECNEDIATTNGFHLLFDDLMKEARALSVCKRSEVWIESDDPVQQLDDMWN